MLQRRSTRRNEPMVGKSQKQLSFDGEAGDPFSDLRHFVLVSELDLNTRARSALQNAGIAFVGQLIAINPDDFIRNPNVGRHTVSNIRAALNEIGLEIVESTSPWSDLDSEDVSESFGWEVQQANLWIARQKMGPGGQGVDADIDQLLSMFDQERNLQIFRFRFGLGGEQPHTLEETGQRFGGITRERVRQICKKMTIRILERTWLLPSIQTANQLLDSITPSTLQSATDYLLEAGLLRPDSQTSLAGLGEISALLKLDFDWQFAERPFDKYIVPKSHPGEMNQILIDARKTISKQGVASYKALAFQSRLRTRKEPRPETIRTLVGDQEGFVELDPVGGWFCFYTKRNRLVNLLRKIFAVSSVLHVARLRRALKKIHRLEGFAPSEKVLIQFASLVPELEVDENTIRVRSGEDLDANLGGEERKMVSIMKEMGGKAHWLEFQTRCLTAGINENTFMVFLHQSPLFVNLGNRIFGLLSNDVEERSPTIDQSKKRANDNVLESGWTKGGQIRIDFQVVENNLYTGFFKVPAGFAKYLDGRFHLETEEGLELGNISVKQQNSIGWGLRKPLSVLGGEVGDRFSITFDLSSRHAQIDFGDLLADE